MDELVIRRAKPGDVDEMTAFLNRAGRGKPKVNRTQVLLSLGEQGYMLAWVGDELHALVGWYTEDLIARIRQVVIYPARLRGTVGRELLEAVCRSAYDLMCEAALLFAPQQASQRLQRFFQSCGFQAISQDDLIPAWRQAALQSMPEDTVVMLRKLREKRVMRPV